MKLFGHPLHVMLIHFPSALLPMELVCSIIGYRTGNPAFVQAAFFAAAGGVLLGWCAVITGTFDLLSVMKEQPGALKKALIHGGINSTVLIGYSILAWIAYKSYPALPPDTELRLIVKAVLVLVLLGGNYIGGSLVLKDRIGAEKH